MPTTMVKPYLMPQPPPDIPWTVSRCNRLLRQLSSFLSKLENWHGKFSEKQQDEHHDGNEDPESSKSKCDQYADGDWLAQEDAIDGKKASRGYSGRRRLKIPRTPVSKLNRRASVETPSLDMGTTPATIRELNSIAAKPRFSDLSSKPQRGFSYASRAGRIEPARLQRRSNVHSCNAERSLDSNFDKEQFYNAWTAISAFLVATSEPRIPAQWEDDVKERPGERGAKSLSSLCQKSVARTMFDEQRMNDSVCDGHDGSVHVSAEFLEDLENHFGDPVHGWPPLRSITRAYGVNLICEAIRTSRLIHNVARELAIDFFRYPIFSDTGEAVAETLIRAQRSTTSMPSRTHGGLLICDVMPGCVALGPFLRASKDYYRLSWCFRMIELIFKKEDALPISRLGKDLEYLRLAVSNLHTGARLGATLLAETLARRLLGLSTSGHTVQNAPAKCCREALFVTEVAVVFKTLLAKMTATQITLQSRCERCSETAQDPTACAEHACHLLDTISTTIAQYNEEQGLQEQSGLNLEGAVLVLFARLLSSANLKLSLTRSCQTVFQELILTSESRGSLLTMLSSFVHLVVKICGKAPRTKSFDVLRQLTDTLSSDNSKDTSQLRRFLAHVAKDAAMAFAQSSPKKAHIDWANELQTRLNVLMQEEGFPRTPSLSQHAYKWDSCVEEWVQKTPAFLLSPADAATSHALSVRMPVPSTETLPTQPMSGSPVCSSAPPLQMNRKRRSDTFEIAWDGDFAYKRRKGGSLGRSTVSHLFGDISPNVSRVSRAKVLKATADDLESDDELTLMM